MSGVLISPSILSADFARLSDEAKLMERAGADWLHVDVMDGHFVPNLTIGPVVVKSLKKHTALPLDVHLMITDPLTYAEPFAKAGAWSMTFHLEAMSDPSAVIREFRRVGTKVGISIRPKTPASAVLPFLKDVDLVLVMTVEPGFGGQSFMADMIPKVDEISRAIRAANATCLIEVDGGIDASTAPRCVAAGARVLVSGNYVFSSKDPIQAVKSLKAVSV